MNKKRKQNFIVAVASIFILFANAIIIGNDMNDNSFSLSELIQVNKAFAEDNCQPTCSPGYGCVGGVCVQLEAAVRSTCTIEQYCWLSFQYKTCNGHQTGCTPNPGGITNCSAVDCACDDGGEPCD